MTRPDHARHIRVLEEQERRAIERGDHVAAVLLAQRIKAALREPAKARVA